MANSPQKSFKTSYFLGLAFIAISFLIYILAKSKSFSNGIISDTFFINYGLCVLYLIVLSLIKTNYTKPRPSIPFECWINVTVLFTISAFALNKEMKVFAQFPQWLNIYTLIMIALFLIYPYVNKLPKYLKICIYLLSGCTIILALYMSLFLAALFPITLISFWFFGLSLHTIVPALCTLVIIIFFKKNVEDGKIRNYLWIGALIPLLTLGVYLNKWYHLQSQIKDLTASKNLELQNQLPAHIYLAQKLPSDPLTDEILISRYKSQRFWDNGFWFDNSGGNQYHNPLSIIAIALFGQLDIDYTTSMAILNIRKDYRHQSSRRLWSGTNLSTSTVSNNIRVYPSYRFAYHEKTFVVHNHKDQESRNAWFTQNTQEAVYTFHVPEGSIVTSLSLWINGKEEKSRLSTSQKADNAYTTIVGVEQRDPALVHWKEGNTVSVTVFPCTPDEDRTFKIGFTCPLSFKEGQLWLENIWFEGPEFSDAREATSIYCEGSEDIFNDMPGDFEKNAKGEFVYKGHYIPDWKIAMKPIELSKNKFRFNGYEYQLQALKQAQRTAVVQEVFLDITKEWKEEEYDFLYKSLSNKKLYTWLPEKVQITDKNKDLVWKEVSQNQFSMPFLYDINKPKNTVIITKSGNQSPLLADLKNSDYAQKNIDYLLSSESKVNVLNFGTEFSALWRSLHEFRLIDYNAININQISNLINSGVSNYAFEDSTTVSLIESNMSIVKSKTVDSVLTANAPDHLLRMFGYNNILRKIGKKYFEKEKYENELFREAEEAYVVTPISSMIVLESETDYKRMGIDKNKNTVGNAEVAPGGGVPEPHEWLLIAIVFFLITKHLYQKSNFKFGIYSKK